MTRDGFDLLVHYLPDYDYASHALGPDAAHEALARADAAIAALFDAAGGPDAFLERYARRALLRPRADADRADGAGSRCPARSSRRRTAPRCSTATIRAGSREALDGEPSVDVALFLEDGEVVARRDGVEDLAILDDYPDGRARAEGALRNPNSGEVLVSAAPRLGVRRPRRAAPPRRRQPRLARGGRTREVPMLTVGLGEPPASITGIKGLLLAHFGVAVASGRLSVARHRPGSSASSSAAGSTTSACSRRWRAFRARLSSPHELREQRLRRRAAPAAATARRSPSPTWSR